MEDTNPHFPHPHTPVNPIDNPVPHPDADNPVLTVYDIDDVKNIRFVADPFLYKEKDDEWYMFFEILPKDGNGHIGRALSKDGLRWKYDQVVINSEDAGSHLSFPLILRCGDSYYMILDRGKRDYIPLYRSEDLLNWNEINRYLENIDHIYRDMGLIQYNDRWWLFVGTDDGGKFSGMRVYYSDKDDSIENMSLHPHKQNPVVKGRPEAARPGGRFLVQNDEKIIAFFQDCKQNYGEKVRAYEITDLTQDEYSDKPLDPNPLLGSASGGWNIQRIHHYDPWYVESNKSWICSVDGYYYSTVKKVLKHGERIPLLGRVIYHFNDKLYNIFPSISPKNLYFQIGIYQVKRG